MYVRRRDAFPRMGGLAALSRRGGHYSCRRWRSDRGRHLAQCACGSRHRPDFLFPVPVALAVVCIAASLHRTAAVDDRYRRSHRCDFHRRVAVVAVCRAALSRQSFATHSPAVVRGCGHGAGAVHRGGRGRASQPRFSITLFERGAGRRRGDARRPAAAHALFSIECATLCSRRLLPLRATRCAARLHGLGRLPCVDVDGVHRAPRQGPQRRVVRLDSLSAAAWCGPQQPRAGPA